MKTKNGTVMSGYQFNTAKECRERTDETDHAKYALPGHQQHHHGCKHEERNEFRAHM